MTRETFQFRVDKKKLQAAEWRDGHYLLRSNLTAGDPSVLWARYVQLTQIESVFRSLKSELGHTPHLPSTGASRRCPHSDRLSRLLLAGNPEAAPVAARPRVDAHGGAGEVSRNANDRRLDSDGRSTLVDSAALHATLRRHQAAHRKTETEVAEPTSTAHYWVRSHTEMEVQPSGSRRFVVETFQ